MDSQHSIVIIDNSYVSFYRLHATRVWYKKAHGDIPENLIDDEPFMTCFNNNYQKCIVEIAKKFLPSIIIFAQDSSQDTLWRKKLYPEYKDGRSSTSGQGPVLKYAHRELVPSFESTLTYKVNRKDHECSLHVLRVDEAEGDDVIAVICRKFPTANISIIANDRDLLQLATDNVHIYKLPKFEEIVVDDPAEELLKKIIKGDPSDNIKPVCPRMKYELAKEVAPTKPLFSINQQLIDFKYIPQNIVDKIDSLLGFLYKIYPPMTTESQPSTESQPTTDTQPTDTQPTDTQSTDCVPNIRLGYACINTTLAQRKISCNKSCIAKTFREKGLDHIIPIVKKNLEAVMHILKWNHKNGIFLYRMSSDMFPHITNPDFIDGDDPDSDDISHLTFAYDLGLFTKHLEAIGRYAKKLNQRITFHPGQYNQIGTPHKQIFRKTARELCFHAQVLDRIGCGPDSVMVVHGGGTYNNKKETMKRWCKQFRMLPKYVQDRIVLENCERQYNVCDILRLAKAVGRPVVFDTFHHECYEQIYEVDIPVEDILDEVVATWGNIRPKFHVSNQASDNKRIGAHSDYVEKIPDYLVELSKTTPIDIMIEAKCKELAVLKLM